MKINGIYDLSEITTDRFRTELFPNEKQDGRLALQWFDLLRIRAQRPLTVVNSLVRMLPAGMSSAICQFHFTFGCWLTGSSLHTTIYIIKCTVATGTKSCTVHEVHKLKSYRYSGCIAPQRILYLTWYGLYDVPISSIVLYTYLLSGSKFFGSSRFKQQSVQPLYRNCYISSTLLRHFQGVQFQYNWTCVGTGAGLLVLGSCFYRYHK